MILSLAMITCRGEEPSVSQASFSGEWAGYVDGEPAWAFLDQSGDGRVSGNLTYPQGALLGDVHGDALHFTLSTGGSCNGLYEGTVTYTRAGDRDRMIFGASGADACAGTGRFGGYLDRLICPPNLLKCGPDPKGNAVQCVDVTTNHVHCGWCGHTCAPDQRCADGRCQVPACTGPVALDAPTSVPVGGDYLTLVLADVDGDGVRDAVVSNRLGLEVMRGDGHGGFGAPVFTPLDGAVATAVGDLDGDGFADAVAYTIVQEPVTYLYRGSVVALLGRGDGSFDVGQVFPADEDRGHMDVIGPRPVALADLDGDGVLDVAARAGVDPTLQVRRGLGDGTFGPAQFHALSGAVRALVASDLDGDGDADLAVLTLDERWQSTLDVLLGNGDGTFLVVPGTEYLTFGQDLAAGDLDGDGVTDLAVARASAGDLDASLLLGRGDGTFAAATPVLGPHAIAVALADLDGDGHGDLVTANAELQLHLGRDDGALEEAFPYPVFPGGYGIWSVAPADLDADGRMDLVVAVSGSGPSGLLVYRACAP